jgi:ankyrin repeat protein
MESIANGKASGARSLSPLRQHMALFIGGRGVTSAAFLGVVLLVTASCSKPERPSITLFEAAEQGNLDQLQRHLYWGCDVNAVNSDYQTPLGLAAKHGRVEAVGLLVSKGANIAKSGALHSAAETGQVEVLETLISMGADVNAKEDNGYTALHEAGKNRVSEPKAARLLIAKGANVNARANDGSTPLHIGAINGNLNLCEVLLLNGAEIDARDAKNRTPLHYSCMIPVHLMHYTVGLLIQKGADVNARDNEGLTPLHLAVIGIGRDDLSGSVNQEDYRRMIEDRCKVARCLLGSHANPHARDNKGYTPIDYAETLNKSDLAKLLWGG